MDKKKFYDAIRKNVNLTTQNVMGMNKVLDYLEQKEENLQQAAYVIATAWWETAQTMQPVREAYWLSESWRKKNLRYYPYYGRGYVQLTWEYNYKKASDYFGVNFVKQPDLVMEPEYALPILVVGMQEGWFTGKKMDDYIDNIDEDDSEELREYKNARRIVNGTDKADTIGRLALVFEKGLKAAGYRFSNEVTLNPEKGFKEAQKPTESVSKEVSVVVPEKKETPVRASLWDLIVKALITVMTGRFR